MQIPVSPAGTSSRSAQLTVDPSTITVDNTVYAKWETVEKHTVTFIGLSGNNGFGTISTQQVVDGECAILTPSSRRGTHLTAGIQRNVYKMGF